MAKHEHDAVDVVETVFAITAQRTWQRARLSLLSRQFCITTHLRNRLFNMNLNVNDNPLLVAPRPVRLTAAYPHFTRIKIVPSPYDRPSDEVENIDDAKHVASRIQSVQPPDKDPSSPRASPRCVSRPPSCTFVFTSLTDLTFRQKLSRNFSLSSVPPSSRRLPLSFVRVETALSPLASLTSRSQR